MTVTAGPVAGAGSREGRPTRAWNWLAINLVIILDALVEGAWIAVVSAAISARGGGPALGPLPFAIAAGMSLVWLRRRHDRDIGLVGLGVIYVGAVLGIGILAGGVSFVNNLPGSLFDQSAAWLAAVAVFRGTRHVDRVDDDIVVTGMLQWGTLLLVIPWIAGAAAGGAEREEFISLAFPSTLLFGAAGLLAVGLARLETLSELSGLDWRRNRAWLMLLGGVLLGMLVIAIPAAFLLGAPLGSLAEMAAGPLSIILSPLAEVGRYIIMFIFFLIGPIIEWIYSLYRPSPDRQSQPQVGGGGLIPDNSTPLEPDQTLVALAVALAVIGAVIVALVVVRASYRRPMVVETPSDEAFEEREFRVPRLGLRVPRLPWLRSRHRPTTASGAYVAFISELDRAPDLARRPDEAPATHAARLRESGLADPRAALLAADYQLERYALAQLGPHETTRALRRFTRLRDIVRRRPKIAAAAVADAPASQSGDER